MMQQQTIQTLMHDEMQQVNHVITQRLQSEVVLVNQLSRYIIHSGGKRMRPLLVLMTANACGYQGQDHISLAAIIEFIHTATLLHDDVVDASELRRGQQTANALFGNEASVLVGDFLYSRAFEMMVDINEMAVMQILARTTNVIAEGEVLQLLNINNPDVTEQQYLKVILSKTAKLFEAGAQLGALIAKQPRSIELALKEYGLHIGTAFQIIDDVLDYTASADEMGKNLGDDLAEGKPTLPLIHIMEKGSPAQSALVRKAIKNGGLQAIDDVLNAIHETKALDYARQVAAEAVNKATQALQVLPDTPYRQALEALASESLTRTL